MATHPSGSGGVGLERSCGEPSPDWIHQSNAIGGVELLEAWFQGTAYRLHRHDTYAIGLTETGVQAFAYRGSTHISTPGHVVVLHPDEPHDGYAGNAAGFGYRLLYVEPSLIFEAVRLLSGHRSSLPFVRRPVVTSTKLATAIRAAFQDDREPLTLDDLVVRLAEGLLAADLGNTGAAIPRQLDLAAIARARQFLDAETTRVVRSWELEAVTGLSRYDLARQFRAVVGTSPYRYSLMRRLEAARAAIARQRPLVDVALDAGFADQAHFTRQFTAAFGLTPARYGALHARERPSSAPRIPANGAGKPS
jgi:AraC-like DNA-binding protein